MYIEVFATHQEVKPQQLHGKTVVVIDVLRATSVICTALANGAKKVKTTDTIEDALQQKKSNPELILGGERQAQIIPGFDLGNSPLEYKRGIIQHKTILLSSTNGTQAVQKALGSKHLLAASFLNIEQVVYFLLEAKENVSLLCSGTNGQFSMDDALCAGLIVYEIQQKTSASINDLGQLVSLPFKSDTVSLKDMLKNAYHLNYLQSIGYQNDIDFCLTKNSLKVLPVWEGDGFIDFLQAEKTLF